MRKALVKKAVTLLLLLTIIVPGCFVRYYDVYGDNKQNLDNANNKKSDLQSEYDKTQKKNLLRLKRMLMSSTTQ